MAKRMAVNDNDCKIQSDIGAIDLESEFLKLDDAIKCLTGEVQVILPMPNVRACNNLDEYFIKSTHGSQRPQKQVPSSSKLLQEPFAVPLVRNFERILKKPTTNETDQATTLLSRVIQKRKSDVFSRTEQLEDTSGPLVLLKRNLNRTIRVLIRRRRNVPYISRVIEYKGVLVLFDKHMNLYLNDVFESFAYKLDGKMLKRTRHRDSLLIRGDNIILIS